MSLSRGHRRKLSRMHDKAERCTKLAAVHWLASTSPDESAYSRELHRGAFHHRTREALALIGRERFVAEFRAGIFSAIDAEALAAIDYWADGIGPGGQIVNFEESYSDND